MKRIVFLNRYFYPDHSATSQILSDLAFHLAAGGRQVRIITSPLRYNDPGAHLASRECVRGVEIDRVATTTFGRESLLGRAIDYGSFYTSAWRLLRKTLEPGDIVVAMTDPPLLSIPALHAVKSRSAHLINWLQDIYPEVAIQLGVPALGGRLGKAIVYLRDQSLRSADVNVAVGARMADKLRSLGSGNVEVIHNWTDDQQITPVHPADNPLRAQWGLRHKFVVGYSGNLGRAHEFDTLLAAAENLRHHPDIVFLFIGEGHRTDALASQVNARGLDSSFRFVPYQDRAVLKNSLSVPDLHWLSLKPALEGLIVPSKFYGVAAAGRPTLAVTASNGEIAELVQTHQCGFVIEPGRGDKLAAAILELSSKPEMLATQGANARAMLEAQFTRRRAFTHWEKVLQRIDASAARNFRSLPR
jgi:colanic acid biosynthesis glycosyl transferase WcaI